MARSTLPAVMQEMACSLERPPKTTATRGLRRGSFIVHDPSVRTARPGPRPRLGPMPEETPETPEIGDAAPARRPATVAVTAGRPAREPDAPLNAPLTMASVYVAGGDLEYGRYTNPTWTAFEEALGALGGRALPRVLLRASRAVVDAARPRRSGRARWSRRGTPTSAASASSRTCEARGRVSAVLVDIADTDAVIAALGDAALVWIESPTNPALEVADLPRLIAAAHDAGAYVVVDNTFATPLLQQPLELGADLVLHSATKYLAGHSDAVIGAVVTRDDELLRRAQGPPRPGRRDPGHDGGLARAARPAHPAPARRAGPGQRPGAGAPTRGSPGAGRGSATPASAGSSRSCSRRARSPPTCSPDKTRLWVHATSLGGVESTLERRRRWKTEPATIPEGLVRMSVGIEDVEDLWADLSRALDDLT